MVDTKMLDLSVSEGVLNLRAPVVNEAKMFVFKQKTAYEVRISDWSSDVCSSDLLKSISDTLGVGTRIEEPSSLPFSDGSTRPTAVAAPVVVGIIDSAAARPR